MMMWIALLISQTQLQSVPEGEWLNTGLAYAYTGEVTVAYSPDHRYLIRYGGCTTGRGCYEDYGYANDLWVLNLDNFKWDMRRAVHMYGAEKRPVNGCSRTFCYDSKRKVFWLCHGISSHGTGGSGAMTSYDPEKDIFTPANPKGGHGGDSTMMVFDPAHDLVIRVAREGTFRFDPKTSTWSPGAKPPGGVGMYRSITCEKETGRVFLISDDAKTLAYDAGADKWTDLVPNGDALEKRSNFVIACDTINKVLIYYAAGSGDGEGDAGKPSVTAIYTPKTNSWKLQQPKTSPPPRLIKASAAYDENHNVMLAYIGGQIWAYRFKNGAPSKR